MIGGLIKGVAGLATGIAGGIKAGKARREANKLLDQEQQYNEDLYNSQYYSDAMERSDNSALLRNLKKTLAERGKVAASTAAIMGATPEAIAAEKEAQNEAIADTMSNIGAINQAYKDNVMSRYLAQRNNLSQQRQANLGQQAQSWSNLMANGVNAIGSAAESLSGTKLGTKLNGLIGG